MQKNTSLSLQKLSLAYIYTVLHRVNTTHPVNKHDRVIQSPHSDNVTRCYFNLCLQQGSRDDRVSRDVFSFLNV